jgi:hypothetical protein
MNRENIIRMAQKAGFVWLGEYHSNLEDFAKLVAQHERERIKAANAPEIERINAHIKELERDAARYREVREWDFCGYDHGLVSPESVDSAVDNARGQA